MSDNDRIVETCPVCKDGIDVPNKGLGRAVAAAWRTRHQHIGEAK